MTLRVALVTDVFFDDPDGERLRSHLTVAREAGASLALLPELPFDPWRPVSRTPRDQDAEPPGGPRQSRLAAAAREVGLAVLGGAIVRDPATGRRHNTAVLVGPDGGERGRYAKVHLPEEEGFWETSHYEPGGEPAPVLDVDGVAVGLQICSDLNRPQGVQLLCAGGAEVIVGPRATPPETWERWKLVLRASAVAGACYLLSPNRPAREQGAPVGGPSAAIDPAGVVLLETTDPVAVVEVDPGRVAAMRREYPGYLPHHPDVYARGFGRVAGAREATAGSVPGS